MNIEFTPNSNANRDIVVDGVTVGELLHRYESRYFYFNEHLAITLDFSYALGATINDSRDCAIRVINDWI